MSSDETFRGDRLADPWFTENVPIMSLDHLLAEQDRYRQQIVLATEFSGTDLVKIDVEGFEAEVIRGMRNTIDGQHPITIVEVLDNNNQILDLLVLDERIRETLALFGPGYHVRHIDETSGQLTDTVRGRNNLFIHEDKLHLLDNYNS